MKFLIAAVLLSLSVPAQAEIICSAPAPDVTAHIATIDQINTDILALSPRIKRAVVESEIKDVQYELDGLKRQLKDTQLKAMKQFNDFLATCRDDPSL